MKRLILPLLIFGLVACKKSKHCYRCQNQDGNDIIKCGMSASDIKKYQDQTGFFCLQED